MVPGPRSHDTPQVRTAIQLQPDDGGIPSRPLRPTGQPWGMEKSKQDVARERARKPETRGPLAGREPAGRRPIEDPALADRANPRWTDDDLPRGAQSLSNPDGTPNVMPPRELEVPVATPEEHEHGTAQDQAARTLDPDVGRDNIREGRGGGTPNPSLAEGGENG